MTNQEHNKYIALAFFVHGAIQILTLIGIGVMFLFFFALIPRMETGDFPVFEVYGILVAVMVLFQMAFALPSFIAGYALWKRKPWAKPAVIVGGVVASLHFPIGTAVCVYAFWFIFGDGGKEIYPSNKHPFQDNNYKVTPNYERDYNAPPPPPNLWE